jgi:hypothetical protein
MVRVLKPGSHIEHVAISAGDRATTLERFMAHRISTEVLELIAKGGTLSAKQGTALANLYAAFFGARPKQVWAEILIEEIGEAKRAKLAHEAAKAVQARPAFVDTANAWSVTSHATEPGRAKERQIPVRAVWAYKGDRKGLVELRGKLESGEPQVLGYVPIDFREWDLPDPYEDEIAWAYKVLVETVGRVAQGDYDRIPEYILDHRLIAWFVDRMGFEGGGGRDHVSAATLLNWLISPAELADELEKYGRRVAERQYDDEADETEEKFSSLAQRVRASLERGCT